MRRIPQKVTLIAASLAILSCLPIVALADPPPGYYDSVDVTSSATLRTTLHAVIDDHQRFPYTSGSTDTWDILNLADQDPDDADHILDVYKNASYHKISGGTRSYNREHTWPKSYGFPDDGSTKYPYTDCHMLRLCDGSYNSSRGNNPYRNCNAACLEKTTLDNNGQGGGSGEYPGNSNWRTGQGPSGTWETWIGRRGDVARALFYADVRYEGGAPEPDLILTDDQALIAASNTGDNEPIAYMGMLAVLLQWHEQDPVDELEESRNDVVFIFQGNRNPFIDNPDFVECLFLNECGAECPQDLDGDGSVSAADLAILLGSWGPCVGCPADFNGDDDVNAADLAQLLWGVGSLSVAAVRHSRAASHTRAGQAQAQLGHHQCCNLFHFNWLQRARGDSRACPRLSLSWSIRTDPRSIRAPRKKKLEKLPNSWTNLPHFCALDL